MIVPAAVASLDYVFRNIRFLDLARSSIPLRSFRNGATVWAAGKTRQPY
jgi:hypothetical protein